MEDHSMNNNPPSTFLDESAHLSWKSILSKSALAAQVWSPEFRSPAPTSEARHTCVHLQPPFRVEMGATEAYRQFS